MIHRKVAVGQSTVNMNSRGAASPLSIGRVQEMAARQEKLASKLQGRRDTASQTSAGTRKGLLRCSFSFQVASVNRNIAPLMNCHECYQIIVIGGNYIMLLPSHAFMHAM